MKAIWSCKIGEVDRGLVPWGGDLPMRKAIAEAYRRLTGHEPDFIFSGWGAELTQGERAAFSDTMPPAASAEPAAGEHAQEEPHGASKTHGGKEEGDA